MRWKTHQGPTPVTGPTPVGEPSIRSFLRLVSITARKQMWVIQSQGQEVPFNWIGEDVKWTRVARFNQAWYVHPRCNNVEHHPRRWCWCLRAVAICAALVRTLCDPWFLRTGCATSTTPVAPPPGSGCLVNGGSSKVTVQQNRFITELYQMGITTCSPNHSFITEFDQMGIRTCSSNHSNSEEPISLQSTPLSPTVSTARHSL